MAYDEILKVAQKVFGVLDVEVIHYTPENWRKIKLLSTMVWEEETTDSIPETMLVPMTGNYYVPVHLGDYLVRLRGGGFKITDGKVFIGRLTPELIETLT